MGEETDNFEVLHGEILDELVAFTGEKRADIRAKMEESIYRTARLFDARPDTPERFYEETDAYIYELACYEKDSWRNGLAEMLGKAMGDRHVLEYGCGIGSFALMLVKAGLRVSACDISRVNLGFLQHRIEGRGWADRIEVARPDAALRPAEHYDVIACQHVLEHVDDPVGLLRQFHRSLVPGGLFTGIAPFDLIGPLFSEHLPENAHLRLEDLCTEAGFQVRNTLPFGNVYGVDVVSVQATKIG